MILYIGISAVVAIILSTIDSDDISKENIATVFLASIATFFSIFIAKAVFHILGRAAIIINSHGLNPASILSNLLYQDITFIQFAFSGSSTISIYSSILKVKIADIC